MWGGGLLCPGWNWGVRGGTASVPVTGHLSPLHVPSPALSSPSLTAKSSLPCLTAHMGAPGASLLPDSLGRGEGGRAAPLPPGKGRNPGWQGLRCEGGGPEMRGPQAIMVGALPRTCFWESAARRPHAVSHVRLQMAPWPGRSLGTQPRRAQQPTCRRPGCGHSPTGRPPTPIRPLRPDWYLVHELGFLSPGPKTSIRTGGSGPVSGYGPIPSCKLPVDGQAHGGTIRSPRTSHQPAQGSDPYGLSTSQKDVAQRCGWDMGPGPCLWRWSPR